MLPRLKILGARGSRPVCDPDFSVYGGNTTCFLIETAEGPVLIDAGTGLHAFDRSWPASDPRPITLVLTHFHLDHLAGLPSARFLYQSGRRLRCFADSERHPDARQSLTGLLRPPYWPVELDSAGAAWRYEPLTPGAAAVQINGLSVDALNLHHPQGSMGLRFTGPECRWVIATDHEPGVDAIDAALVEFARKADYLLLDAQFKPSQRRQRVGWGHGDWERAIALARQADVRHLILIHHDPSQDDMALRGIETIARRAFPSTRLAREGMILSSHESFAPEPSAPPLDPGDLT